MNDEHNGEIIITPDYRSVLWIVLILVGFLGTLIFFAMRGEVVPAIILAVISTASLITLGSRLHNSARRTEIEAQGVRNQNELQRWRLNVEENTALLGQQADAQGKFALAQTRQVTAAVKQLQMAEEDNEEELPPAIVAGGNIYQDLVYTEGDEND